MSSQIIKNKNQNNDFNRNRTVINNDYDEAIENGKSQNTNNMNLYPTEDLEESPNMAFNYGQQSQVIKINGKLYAPVQQATNLYGRKLIKYVNNNSPVLVNKMSQQTMNQSNTFYGNPLQTPDNYHHLQENTNPTSKRRNEQLNRSNEQKKKTKREDTYHQQYQQTKNERSPRRNTVGKSANATNNTTANKMNSNGKQLTIPNDQLKRAVGSNLPCFVIQFERTIAPRDLPSAIITSDIIMEHFKENDIHIEKFSVPLFTGHRLKLRVNNIEDYATLIGTDKWPTAINRKTIEIIKPKFVPECFTLVIRYLPHEISMETVTDKIKRSINSADNFKQIKYSFNRPTKDVRFTVADLIEYEGALKLDRLAIVNRLHPVTKYLSANKMTFCTNCWKVSHLRTTCKSSIRKCRVCLKAFDHEHINKCSGQPRCAQCGSNHHSLDPKCEVIQQYRQALNQEVKQAVNDGIINRRSIPLHQQQLQACPIRTNEEAKFPSISRNHKGTYPSENRAWPHNTYQTTSIDSTTMNSSLSGMLIKMNKELKKELQDLKNIIGKKLYEKININSGNIQLHQVGINTINTTVTKIIKEVLIPMVNLIPEAHQSTKQQLTGILQNLELTSKCQCDNVRLNFNIGQVSQQRNNIKITSLTEDIIINHEQSLQASPTTKSPTLNGSSEMIEDPQ